MLRTTLLLLCLTWPAAPLGAADAGATEKVPVPEVMVGLDERIELISTAVEADREAAGLGWRPNEACESGDALALARDRFKKLVGERRAWLAERRQKTDQLAGHEFLHFRTRHFDLSLDLDELRVGRKKLDRQQAGVLYATRLEDYHDDLVKRLKLNPARMKAERRHQVFLLEKSKDAQQLTTELLGNTLGSGHKSTKVGSLESATLIWNDPNAISSDQELYQILIHCVAHNLYHDVGAYKNWLFDEHGWLYEGLAYYDVIRMFGPPITTCDFEDALDFKHWLSPHWEANIRRAVKTRRDPDPATVLGLGVEAMNAKHRQLAWSYIDFLMWYDASAMYFLLDATKGEGIASAKALSDAYDLDLATFQSEWKAFVRKQYSSKPRKGPTPPRSPRKSR